MYDLRHTTTPLAVLGNHGRSVSYVRFVNQHHLASASTDSTLRLWDIRGPLHDAQQGPGQGGPLTQQQPAMLYKVCVGGGGCCGCAYGCAYECP